MSRAIHDFELATRRGFFGVAVWNPKREENVGGILRCAHNFGASHLLVLGERFRRYNSDTTNATKHIPTTYVPSLDRFAEFVPDDTTVVAIEIAEDAESLIDYCHPTRALYVLGPEDGTLPDVVLQRANHLVCIPMQFCANVSSAAAIVLYDRTAKIARARCHSGQFTTSS